LTAIALAPELNVPRLVYALNPAVQVAVGGPAVTATRESGDMLGLWVRTGASLATDDALTPPVALPAGPLAVGAADDVAGDDEHPDSSTATHTADPATRILKLRMNFLNLVGIPRRRHDSGTIQMTNRPATSLLR
jgi:hypothetical protein